MDIQTNVAPSDAGQVANAPVTPPAAPANEAPINPRDAGRALAMRRVEKAKERQAAEAAPPVETEAAPPQTEELALDANAAPLEEAPGETPEHTDPADTLPPIEPPRSWTKEKKEAFNSLPRDLQEYVADSAKRQESEFRRSQNEAAEKTKATEAERQAVEKVRQQYEEALPALLQTLQGAQAGEFADIKTMADVQRMATEDWPRYIRYDAHQKQIAAVQHQFEATQQRQQQERAVKFQEFSTREDELLKERVPELSDPEKAKKLGTRAIDVLKDIGLSDQELGQMWSGQQHLSLRDHRVQLLVLDAVKWRDAQAARRAAVPKPLPPVQRPGVAQPKGAAAQAQVQALTQKAENTGSLKDGVAALIARRQAARR